MKAIISLSGGMDSATVLAVAIQRGIDVRAVGFRYGSKHGNYENVAAEKLAVHYGVPFCLVDLTSITRHFSSHLLQHGGEIPEGHYESETMAQTVVPARNMIFASVLAGVAWTEGAGEVWLGIHAGDHAIYPDCRPAFFGAMKLAVEKGSDDRVILVAPFLHSKKGDILSRGLELGVPYELTRTCYKDQSIACGRCGACRERLEAFEENGARDPVEYGK